MAAAGFASPDHALRELLLSLQLASAPSAVSDDEIVLALDACRRLYAAKRSNDALPLARAAVVAAQARAERPLMRRAATVLGLLCADSGDAVAAIESHVQALRIAIADDDRTEMSRIWNNIGVAVMVSGNVLVARRCYQRALAIVETRPEPVYSRFAAYCNLASCGWRLGHMQEGLDFAQRGTEELTPDFCKHDPHAAVLLLRNLVLLLVACDRADEAEPHVQAALKLATTSGTSRSLIAAETARAALDLARGQPDIALTRLDHALSESRKVPGALMDTLICMIRSEEQAGHASRALVHLEELSEHVYRAGLERARRLIEQAGLGDVALSPDESQREQYRARLISKLERPMQPESWKALQRMGVNAALRMDETGWHGKRVGALTKALAEAHGMTALQAQEVGLAAELHDVGMMSVPEGILAKSGPLNDAERAVVLRHVDAGAEVLADASHARMLLARDIAQYHHAHWDGRGTPERVGGDFIPLAARMCAIADAYDMMIAGFGGGRARSMEAALAELGRCAGTQFDPELVAVFDELIRNESRDLGLDLTSAAGMDGFQDLITALKEDKGFL